MRVAVITRHAVPNYGSLLQALATQWAVEALGHSCQIIDYVREDEEAAALEPTLLSQKQRWNKTPLHRFAYLALRQPESMLACRKFRQQQLENLNLTKRYSSLEALTAEAPEADVYMTGSDQVWGPVGPNVYDSAYLLSFAPEGKKRVAYAASFGRLDLDEATEALFNRYLPVYQRVAVREDSASEALQQRWHIEAEHVLDPTLLLDGNKWRKTATAKRREAGYVLIYQIQNFSPMGEYARLLARELGLPLIRMSASFHHFCRPGRFVPLPAIGEFISLIDNASLLVTDSFHGTAFAINLNTPFIDVLPSGNKTMSRLTSILRVTGLEGRVATDLHDASLAHEVIDWPDVNNRLQAQREKSLSVLRRMIED